MSIRTDKLIDNVRIDDDPTSASGSLDLKGITPKRITFLFVGAETGTSTMTVTVEISPDEGVTLVGYDKIIDGSGVDAPVSSIAYTATADDVFSLSLEDIITYFRVTVTGTVSDVDNYFVVSLWSIIEY